jgi:selenocysteine-specific elongation factor
MYVIGTAGHVDHGKSSLIQALTGINPDRLREEQERGLTIELGFAWLTLPSGREISIVDVPGHVRFVRHMLAGIGAVDLALVVIAADEGVMPQTHEHLEILDLLEVQHAVVALSKVDLVEGDWADLMEEEVRELIESTSISASPIVRVSAVTGEGLDELRVTLDAALDSVEEPSDIGRPRLGIDRVFTMSGFGTVVTGTLLGGQLRLGDTLEVIPDGPTARVRGLQTHQQEVDAAQPGTRVAVNLSGVGTEELRRGQVLAPPGRMARVTAFDVRLRALSRRALPHNLRVAVHTGAAEAQGRVRVLDGDEIEAGESGWAQVVLTSPLACVPGDLMVLRVSDETVAGGRVVEVNPPRHRRRDAGTIERLEAMSAGTPESETLAALERLEPVAREPLLAAVELDASSFEAALAALVAEGAVRELRTDAGVLYLMSVGLNRLRGEAEQALAAYHDEFPLRFTMSREELRSRLHLGQREFTAVLGAMEPGIVARGDGVSDDGWTPEPNAADSVAITELERTLAAGALQPPRVDVDPEVVAHLDAAGRVVDCGNGVVVSGEAFAEAERRVRVLLAVASEMTLAEARDALETNRRVAQAVLEELDRRGVTRRRGEARVLASG